ncbi:hypothetical protein BJ912DRAFT_931927 [Pholiota molesta]|nr:hypothetical protein BJ912DRAFT_931927 [Pholiota molesta]
MRDEVKEQQSSESLQKQRTKVPVSELSAGMKTTRSSEVSTRVQTPERRLPSPIVPPAVAIELKEISRKMMTTDGDKQREACSKVTNLSAFVSSTLGTLILFALSET